jgi:serine O-acetyltransferase
MKMKFEDIKSDATCRTDAGDSLKFRESLPEIVDSILAGCADKTCHSHIAFEPIPSKESVIEIINLLKEVLFPGYFSRGKLDPVNLKYNLGQSVSILFDMLSEQICRSIRHDCFRYDKACAKCQEQGNEMALKVLRKIPMVQQVLASDIAAAYEGDPAAKSYDEIIFSYPGLFAIWIYRMAHELWHLDIPFLPRIMTEYAHSMTGIDIHPGADIGERFVIDHGTGVVIGETTVIGDNVRIYQGVTLGALSLPKDAGETLRGKKRHPTIESDVIIYSGATILGGDTLIGKGSMVGGNVWITQSIPPYTKVLMEAPKLIYR